MKDVKRQIILDEGSPVEVIDSTGVVVETTKALLGRANKVSYAEISLEAHRQGQFVPEITVHNGNLVRNAITDTHYLVLASMDEIVQSDKIATICRMLECNSSITLERIEETADENGNIKKSLVLVADELSVYVESGRAVIEQKNMGLLPEVEFRIYAPLIDVKLLDKISLTINGKKSPFKVDALDFVSFEGCVMIDVCTETRK